MVVKKKIPPAQDTGGYHAQADGGAVGIGHHTAIDQHRGLTKAALTGEGDHQVPATAHDDILKLHLMGVIGRHLPFGHEQQFFGIGPFGCVALDTVADAQQGQPALGKIAGFDINWSICAYPGAAWARQVFPDLTPDQAQARQRRRR